MILQIVDSEIEIVTLFCVILDVSLYEGQSMQDTGTFEC